MSDQTVHDWRNQDRIDRGLRSGLTTAESVELAAARKRIRELETEVAVTKRANELLGRQITVARCAVELVMRRLGLAGLPGRPKFRTIRTRRPPKTWCTATSPGRSRTGCG